MGSRPFKDWWKVVQCSKAWVLDTSWHILTHPLLRRSFRSLQIFVWHRWLLAVVSLQPQVVARGSKSLHPGLQEGHWWCRLVQGTSTVWTDGQTSKSKLRPYSQEKSTNMSKHSKRLTIQCDQCKVLCGRSCRCTISVHQTGVFFPIGTWMKWDEVGRSGMVWVKGDEISQPAEPICTAGAIEPCCGREAARRITGTLDDRSSVKRRWRRCQILSNTWIHILSERSMCIHVHWWHWQVYLKQRHSALREKAAAELSKEATSLKDVQWSSRQKKHPHWIFTWDMMHVSSQEYSRDRLTVTWCKLS